MNIVAYNPQPWKVPVKLDEQNRIVELYQQFGDSDDAAPVEAFAFAADLEFAGYVRANSGHVYWMFVDAASGVRIRFTAAALDELIREIAAERVVVRDGKFRGKYTFKNFAGYVCCVPLDRETELMLGL